MIDLKTDTPPLFVVRIEVENLFGRYNYTLSREDNYNLKDSSLIILYGDNGSGKTTILKLLFHLLSSRHKLVHHTCLAQTYFSRFAVFLADGTTIIASRQNSNLIGSFKIDFTGRNNNLCSVDIQVDHPDDFVGFKLEKLEINNFSFYEEDHPIKLNVDKKQINDFYGVLSSLQLSVFFLNDDRVLDSNIFESEVKVERESRRDNVLSLFGSVLAGNRILTGNQDGIDKEVALKTSLYRMEEWIREQALKGANQGDTNVNHIYEQIIAGFFRPSEKSVEEELTKSSEILINTLIAAEDRSKKFSHFGLMSSLDTQKIVSILKSHIEADYSIVSRVLQPYIESLTARFEALQDTQNLLTIFENTINQVFFRDKYIKLHVTNGLKIFTDEGKELSPQKLSSGEKQLLLLFCNTLTARDKATIFIIDEPEISLNVKWQRQLIHALLELTKESQVQFILATHSIELLSQYNNNVIKLVKT